ncbi:protein translocase subunit SecD [Antribacter gilvus]|uniref:protein translocase subunit SecD n=1 Tax=Antribacter gilvus TaxID=2304675 RepID=UPI000F7A72FD|nr:protein translocase subunit SecD [Antribacter gilvus]
MTVLTILLPLGALLAGAQLDPRSSENPDGASLAPGLALDLQGGTQVILRPVTTDGSEVTDEALDEAINVIRQRIDSSGVSESEIASQGGENIVVGIAGEVDDDTIALISKAAQMKFRPVLTYDVGMAAPEPSASASADPSAAPSADASAAPSDDAAVASPAPDASASPSAEPSAPAEEEAVTATDPSDLAQITPAVQEQFAALDCTDPENLKGGGGDDPTKVLVTCQQDGALKYILGPVEVAGTDLTNASSGLQTGANGTVTGEWAVNLQFNGEGTEQFAETTTRLQGLESPRNQFAITLDGLVVSAPSLAPGVIINDGRAEISGSFTQESAATLANQLSFGSLPLTFEVQSQEQISATLGSEQLQRGLFAGLIGLLLVVVYSMFQYRTLGLLTVSSLVVAGVMTYVVIALLSWGMGYRLSLPGVAGLIVAIGFTADSFIVYFERIRDELRDGRTLRVAVERGWDRARRTVLAAKGVNLLSAVILYYMTVGGVQGFAFTLGLTTIIDVMVVFWFTHPVMELISKVKFFRDGHRASGLSPDRLQVAGPRYVGAGRVATGAPATATATAPAAVEDAPAEAEVPQPVMAGVAPQGLPQGGTDGRRMTIAERRAAERRAAAVQADAPVDENEEKH